MADPEAIEKAYDSALLQLKAEENRMRTIAREEAREEAIERRNELAEEVGLELAKMQRDLKWLLAIPRGYRALKQLIVRLIPSFRARKVAQVFAILASTATIVHYVYGWPRLLAWLAKIFTGQ